MGWLFIFLSEKLCEIPLATLKGITVFPLRYEFGCSLYSGSRVVSILSQGWGEEPSLVAIQPLLKPAFPGEGRKAITSQETGHLAEPSPGNSEVSSLYNQECNQGLHSCGIAFSFAGIWWTVEAKPTRVHHQ